MMDEQTGARESRQNVEEESGGQQIGNDPSSQQRRGGRNRHRGQARPQQQHAAKSSLNMNELRELAELINEHGFTDFEFENENIRVRLRKELAPQIVQTAAPQSNLATPIQNVAQPQNSQTTAAAATPPVTIDEDANLKKITSPIVGTFYRSPSPEADPFVNIGSQVSTETTVCIVEAMKLMNEIPAEVSGEIVKIYVENGQPVEYGQPLFAVK